MALLRFILGLRVLLSDAIQYAIAILRDNHAPDTGPAPDTVLPMLSGLVAELRCGRLRILRARVEHGGGRYCIHRNIDEQQRYAGRSVARDGDFGGERRGLS